MRNSRPLQRGKFGLTSASSSSPSFNQSEAQNLSQMRVRLKLGRKEAELIKNVTLIAMTHGLLYHVAKRVNVCNLLPNKNRRVHNKVEDSQKVKKSHSPQVYFLH